MNTFLRRSHAVEMLFMTLTSISVVGKCHSAGAIPGVSSDDVWKAWSSRSTEISSVNVSYSLTEVISPQEAPQPLQGNPFEEFTPPNEAELTKHLTFALSGNRIALRMRGDAIRQNGELGARTNTTVFNGKVYKTLVESELMPLGSFDRRGRAGDQVTRNYYQNALWLWCNPIQLMEKVVWDIKRMRLNGVPTIIDGVECARFSVPRKSPGWLSYVYVDLSAAHLPRRWEVLYKGKLLDKLTIQYQKDPSGIAYVSQWSSVRYSSAGKLEAMCLAKVEKCELNKPIDDNVFELDFPMGTHLYEELGDSRRYYIQEASGMREIKETEYGATKDGLAATNTGGRRG